MTVWQERSPIPHHKHVKLMLDSLHVQCIAILKFDCGLIVDVILLKDDVYEAGCFRVVAWSADLRNGAATNRLLRVRKLKLPSS